MNEQALLEILTRGGGTWGLVIKRIGEDATFLFNADSEFPAASVGKVPIALYVLHQVEEGKIRLHDRFSIDKEFYLGGAGVIKYMEPGVNLSLKDIVSLMLITSDNTAAKFLVRYFGGKHINTYLQSLGFKKTGLGVYGEKFDYGVTTPQEMATMLEKIYTRSFLSSSLSNLFIDIMKHCHNDINIKRRLPDKLEVANKGGIIPGVRNDLGLIFTKKPYILSIFSRGLRDRAYRPENPGVLTIADISDEVYAQMK